MLPTLDRYIAEDLKAKQFRDALCQQGFRGDIEIDIASRTVQSVDNSIYQQFPCGILYPRSHDDVCVIMRTANLPAFADLVFAARGGATGTNGQSLTSGWVIDLSRHMNQILEINHQEGWARVQTGVVKDALNHAVKDYGLFFAPDLSTSNRATIGGMINTDASGQGSAVYGKTSDHLLSSISVLHDGSTWHCQPLSDDDLEHEKRGADLKANIHKQVANIVEQQAELITNNYPKLQRAITGYDLARIRQLTNDHQTRWNFNKLLSGSEGTLAIITEAVVNLEPIAQHTQLFVCSYPSMVDALRHNEKTNQLSPLSIETIDDKVISLAQQNILWDQVKHLLVGDAGEIPGAVSFIEILATDDTTLASEVNRFESHFHSTRSEWIRFKALYNAKDRTNLIALRKKAVGLLGSMRGDARPVPFVEDVGVPTEHLADFIADFKQLLDQHHLHYGIFGHADAGVMHVRPALNLRSPAVIEQVRKISDEVFALVRRFGGVMWGEHGKGVRSEYSPITFGELYPVLQQIKAVFDPNNRLNPGKIATPNSTLPLTRIDELDTRGKRDRIISSDNWQTMGELPFCNGNGACFDWAPHTTICPSFKASGLRRYSPKGRAQLIKEWLAQLGAKGYDLNQPTQPRLWQLPHKIVNQLRQMVRPDTSDFSTQVADSMSACLSCKACATQCPIHVDIPAARSQFYSHYYSRYLRPVRHFFIANLERMLPTVAQRPGLYRHLTQSTLGKKVVETCIGLVDLPALSNTTLRELARRKPMRIANEANLARVSGDQKQRAVILVQDCFNHYFDADVIADCYHCLEQLGFLPFLAPLHRNGKALDLLGYTEQFAATACDTARELKALAKFAIPLVGIDPSITLSYRHEYAKVLNTPPEVHLLQEWLSDQQQFLTAGFKPKEKVNERPVLFLHCTEASQNSHAATQWQNIFNQLGFNLSVQSTGCCGMAGIFGMEKRNRELSKQVYQLSWQSLVDENIDHSTNPVLVTGFSCRSQVLRFSSNGIASKHSAQHPLQWLLKQIMAKRSRSNCA